MIVVSLDCNCSWNNIAMVHPDICQVVMFTTASSCQGVHWEGHLVACAAVVVEPMNSKAMQNIRVNFTAVHIVLQFSVERG